MNAEQTYRYWLEKLDPQDPLYAELKQIEGDEAEITDRFYQDIEFGTAGLRGICGAGTNRMNVLTVGRATQGIANYILKSGQDPEKGVVIAYDCRYHSREFSELVAMILAGNGIRAYLFPSLRPTPELSFAIRKLHTVSGINMTASHNPKEYNGYKVYWDDGAQISGEVSDGMTREIMALDLFDEFKQIPLEKAVEKGLIHMLGEDMDRSYLDYVKSLSLRPDEELDRSVAVVYTPLNGAGSIPMSILAKEMGFENFVIVPEQKDPDPEFTTVGYPNPEDHRAFALSEELGSRIGAEVLIATDPDADRMAIEIADGKGGFIPLNGNQTGALLIAYKAAALKEHGELSDKSAMIKSIVTGNMGRVICEDYGIRVFEALTGFKNICGVIPRAEKLGYDYFFGYEESIGCAPGEPVRDKDGIAAGMLIAEIAAYYKKKNMSIGDALEELYKKYGYFAEDQVSIVLKGQAGAEKIKALMTKLRDGKPQSFGPFTVKETVDYVNGYEDIPASNVLKFTMTDGSWFCARPSGTEPKIKFYYYAVSDDKALSARRVEDMKAAVGAMIDE